MSSPPPPKKSRKETWKRSGDDDLGDPDRSTASRKLKKKFNCNDPLRIHAFEYGDSVVFPCGAEAIVQDHTAKCTKKGCNAHRFIMDSWQIHLDDVYGTDASTRQYPPAITLAGVSKILRIMGSNFSEVTSMGGNWNPYKPVMYHDQTRDRLVPHRSTFVQIWESFHHSEKQACLRPELPLPSWRFVQKDQGNVVPIIHRQFNTHVEALEYILKTAVADGKLDQKYINKVLENYGIFDLPSRDVNRDSFANQLFYKCESVSVIDMEEAFQQMQIGTANQAEEKAQLVLQKHSPYMKLYRATHDTVEGADVFHKQEHRLDDNWPTLVQTELSLANDQGKKEEEKKTPEPVRRGYDRNKTNENVRRALDGYN